jgi:hypothetical protein
MKLEKSANRCEKSGMERQYTKTQDKWKYMSLLQKTIFFLIFLISFIFSIFFIPGNQQGNANTVSRMAAVVGRWTCLFGQGAWSNPDGTFAGGRRVVRVASSRNSNSAAPWRAIHGCLYGGIVGQHF